MNNIYGSDVTTATEQELIAALKGLAERWRKEPHLSNDFSEGVRYGEIKNALASRFEVEVDISADSHATDYQMIYR